jgi:hypothetical protein
MGGTLSCCRRAVQICLSRLLSSIGGRFVPAQVDHPTRDAGLGTSPPIAAVGDRWAVIVGISTYRNQQLNLKWARRGAEELAALLQTPEGGNFPTSRMRLLLDEEASTGQLTRALRGFLLDSLCQWPVRGPRWWPGKSPCFWFDVSRVC